MKEGRGVIFYRAASIKIPRKVIAALQKICSEENVYCSDNPRIAYSRDSSTSKLLESHAGKISQLPDVVVIPKNAEEISKILALANLHKIPVIAYGGGSGVCGAAVPAKGGIVIDIKRLDKILSIDREHLIARVQTGIVGEILERELNVAGYTLGHFPSSIYSATLGGYLACRSAGQLSTKYGKIEDMVQALTVCLADGKTIQVHAEEKNSLQDLFVGSEGTLGVITEASLKIHPLPEARQFVGYRFSNLSQGLEAIRLFMQRGLRPAVVRLYDPFDSFFFQFKGGSDSSSSWSEKLTSMIPESVKSLFMELHRQSFQGILSEASALNRFIDWVFSSCLLILGFEGPAWKVKWESHQVNKICEFEKGKNLGEEVGLRWLKKRYSMGYKLSPLIAQGCFADTMEVAAPWSKLEELYKNVKKAISPKALVMAHFSHAYHEGCSIYFTFAAHASSYEGNLRLHREIWDLALKATAQSGGTISHHHGVGSLKAQALVEQLGPLMAWFKKTKQVLDPKGILNPGKMGL